MAPDAEAARRALDRATPHDHHRDVPGIVEDGNGLVEELQNAVVPVHLLHGRRVQKQGVPQIARALAVDQEVGDVLHVNGNGHGEHSVGNGGGAVLG